jgi:hypothetical protein
MSSEFSHNQLITPNSQRFTLPFGDLNRAAVVTYDGYEDIHYLSLWILGCAVAALIIWRA